MDVEERAKKYAEGKALKALESITSAIKLWNVNHILCKDSNKIRGLQV